MVFSPGRFCPWQQQQHRRKQQQPLSPSCSCPPQAGIRRSALPHPRNCPGRNPAMEHHRFFDIQFNAFSSRYDSFLFLPCSTDIQEKKVFPLLFWLCPRALWLLGLREGGRHFSDLWECVQKLYIAAAVKRAKAIRQPFPIR